MQLSRADRALVRRTANDIDEARQRGDKHYLVERPEGLTCSDEDFERAVVEELGRRGKIERTVQS